MHIATAEFRALEIRVAPALEAHMMQAQARLTALTKEQQ